MTGQKPLHESAERLVMGNFNHKVKMIRHQASGNLPIFLGRQTSSLSRLQRLERSAAIEPFDRTQGRLLERLEQAQAKIVLSSMKDRRATISSVDHMINKTSLLPTRDSRHQQRLSHRYMRSQREKSSPLIPPGMRAGRLEQLRQLEPWNAWNWLLDK
jgi:hypothetical protein